MRALELIRPTYHDDVVKLTKLRALRQRKALSQKELAEKAGVSRVTVARVEACIDEPYPSTIRKLAGALDVEPAALMDDEAAA